MRTWVICVAALLGLAFSISATRAQPTSPGCGDPIKPNPVANPNVSIALDGNTAWQPRGGTVSVTVRGNGASLSGADVMVCFGWPAKGWWTTTFPERARVSVAKFDTNSVTYNVIVPPDLAWAPASWRYRTALWLVPLAAMRVMVSGGPATPPVDAQLLVGITYPPLALLLAAATVAIAFVVFYAFARNRGVPGKGLLLWMISTPNGVASLSQAQIVLWTFLIGAAAVYVMALSGVLINISDSTLVLLGIAGVATVGAKLQDYRQRDQADGRMAVPGPVLNLDQVGTATDTEVRLAWAPPTSGGPVTHYVVEYRVAPVERAADHPVWSVVNEPIVVPHVTVLNLMPGTTYQFRVRAANSGGPGDPASTDQIPMLPPAQVAADAPGQIGGLYVAEAPTIDEVKLAWSEPDGAPTSYVLQYREHDTVGAWVPVAPAPTRTQHAVTGLASGVRFDFRVAAVNAAGQGCWSAVVTSRTLRDPQWSDLVVTGPGRGQVDVTRAQMLFFTLVAGLFVGLKVLTSYVIPEIPQGILLLMGISNGVYLTAKFIPD